MDASQHRLCSIYLRDLLLFIDSTLVNKCRQVSSRCDSVICSTSDARLPKRYFAMHVLEKVGA
jgi:hypothetical protein